ncbi:DUF397 domain-containing protein [Haloechinothrix sp. YIM 98757]|uniref:DUF397 domain-containing protein n=1 Tax=Haloechinothrix aidingensis TaxID=2752311 RepID=A0A838AB33_9PSEU|nr:DUF397 domain-containing protein [Haloechinothrix aidingensis]MBA0126462.1 DUF397 domain-containing protein [Haloechinothrix aidingensis]
MTALESTWRKSSYSGTQSACVELALEPAQARVRDTKDRDGGTLRVPFAAWQAFTSHLREQ